jgi:uncharacterized flavoprotein (TIGR03862 family)
MNSPPERTASIVVVGAGPAGLMAAEVCAQAGMQVDVYDAMPSVGRKFLLAGKGGLNLTHSEPLDSFYSRYGSSLARLQPLLDSFGPAQLREWVHGLGIGTFVGSSGRVFPREMKAAPLLRAWLKRLREGGVTFHSRRRWTGWLEASGADTARPVRLRFANGHDESIERVACHAAVLALGGGSWPRLGSDGAWQAQLGALGVALTPLAPSNCGFDCGWSPHFSGHWAGAPVKSVAAALTDGAAAAPAGTQPQMRRGEFVITSTGVEGSLVYSVSAEARGLLASGQAATLEVDLLPDRAPEWIREALERPRGSRSRSNHLRRNLGLDGVKAALLRECLPPSELADPEKLASGIKRLPVKLLAPRPLAEAISSAGGVRFDGLDSQLMLQALPGVFCAGEMIDWEAPTGGYLLTACLATGRAAGIGAVQRCAKRIGSTPGDRAFQPLTSTPHSSKLG